MITKFSKDRSDQDNRKSKSKDAQEKDKANDVLYKL
jgi:hypothetical protein